MRESESEERERERERERDFFLEMSLLGVGLNGGIGVCLKRCV